MLERVSMGRVPSVPHTASRTDDGALLYEHCVTRDGFDGPYSILYHLRPPHLQSQTRDAPRDVRPERVAATTLAKRHFRTAKLAREGDALDACTPLLVSDDVALALVTPTRSEPRYVLEGDADVLYFVIAGSGTLRTVLGDVPFDAHDYVFVPRGIAHRLVFADGERTRLLRIAMRAGFGLLPRHTNGVGQLRMDAPIGHRDFRRPTFTGPLDEGIRELVVARRGHAHTFVVPTSPLDVVGWEGTVYPWALPIRAFRPRVGAVHLPPDVHGTFAAEGVLISSFVPRPLDFARDAIPCPYPHSSVDCDEVIFYASGDFLSRRGIEPGSVTLHPAGIPHGPVAAAYEASIGKTHVDEIAVMLDLTRPLDVTTTALAIEDDDYHASYVERGPDAR